MNNENKQFQDHKPSQELQDGFSGEHVVESKEKPVRERPKISEEPKKKKKVQLSFEDEELSDPIAFKITKNPALSKQSHRITESRKSSNAENLQEILKAEYLQKIQRLKEQLIEFEYRFWEGGELFKKLRRKKKQKVKEILEVCRLQLISSFKSLAYLKAEDLLMVIKDFIIPHEMAIYQIEALQLKTKKNQLLMNLRNVKIKKQNKQITMSVNIDSPIKIIEKSTYQKNKHLYPFCNWQLLKITSQ